MDETLSGVGGQPEDLPVPENWLDPELRDGRTHLFTTLTGTLLQGDITDRLAEDAFVAYLRGLADIARLDIACVWQEPDALHVIGRDYNNPRSYYYRRFAHRMWTPWEPIGAQIEGDHVTAVVYRGTLHLFWVTFLEKGAAPDTGNKAYADLANDEIAAPEVTVQAQLHWTELVSGSWAPRSSSDLVVVGGPVPHFDAAKVFVSASRKRDSAGADASVTIHLDTEVDFPDFRVNKGIRSPGFLPWGVGLPMVRNDFVFVSRNGPPALVEVENRDHSIGIGKHSPPALNTYSGRLVADSAGPLRGGVVLDQARPFTAVAPPQPAVLGSDADARLLSPFFYVDRFGGQNTFFVERSVQVEKWNGGSGGWLPVGIGKPVDVGLIKPVVPPFVQVLETGVAVQVPVDPIDPVSILDRIEPGDWATKADGRLRIGERELTRTGQVRRGSTPRRPGIRELEA